MKLNSRFKVILLFSACFVVASVLLAHEFAVGVLSPRALGIALLVLCVGGGFVFVVILVKVQHRLQAQREASSPDAIRKRRLSQIRVGKIAIVILVLALINGLVTERNAPLLPLLVGVTMNLLITFAIARTVIRLQRRVKDDTGSHRS